MPPETEWLVFKPSGIHGVGAFARVDIPPGISVIEYLGEPIDKQESLRRCQENNEFIFTLDAEHDIDGNVSYNPARFINHSCAPNSEAQVDSGHIWIISTRAIRAGEEVTFNYGFDLVDYKDYPCRCGAFNCVGYMVAEELFDHVRKQKQYS